MDMISTLPDEIICRILSFLQIKEAALTSLLSKRWKNLFALTPDLELSFVKFDFWHPKGNASFIRFVDNILGVSNHTIKKFSLELRQKVPPDDVNRWITIVLSRGLLELDLDKLTGGIITLPLEIFTCDSLVKMKLGMLLRIPTVPNNASLPALKTLFLHCVKFSGYGFETLISACQVLEELTVRGSLWDWGHEDQSHTVSCPTLKRFIVKSKRHREYVLPRCINFDTPNLEYLEYSDNVADEYHVVDLNFLVEAKIELCSPTGKSNPTNMIKGLRNVEILELSSHETLEGFHNFGEAIPLFENLTRLSIATGRGLRWTLLPLLLKKTPNLETLVIDGYLHYYDEYVEEEPECLCGCLSEYSFVSSCFVKVLEITKYRGTKRDLKQMKLIMEKSPCLELIKVHACEKANLSYATDLLRLPVAREIQLKFFPSPSN